MTASAVELKGLPIRVLVVDDAASYRRILTQALGQLPGVEVAGVAGSILAAQRRVAQGGVDAVTIDVALEGESGLDLLTWLRAHHPAIVPLLVTAGTERAARTEVDGLFLGAHALLIKPTGEGAADRLREDLARALGDRPSRPALYVTPSDPVALQPAERELILVGASTGGPPVVLEFLKRLPADFAVPVLVVQHMPAFHIPYYVDMLKQASGRAVSVAEHGETVTPGRTYVAGNAKHMRVIRTGGALRLALDDGPEEHFCRPAVDPLFRSAAEVCGRATVGVVMTGMGSDGALGALALKLAGAPVVAQDEGSSVVWGMPRAVIDRAAAAAVVPGDQIAAVVAGLVRRTFSSKEKP